MADDYPTFLRPITGPFLLNRTDDTLQFGIVIYPDYVVPNTSVILRYGMPEPVVLPSSTQGLPRDEIATSGPLMPNTWDWINALYEVPPVPGSPLPEDKFYYYFFDLEISTDPNEQTFAYGQLQPGRVPLLPVSSGQRLFRSSIAGPYSYTGPVPPDPPPFLLNKMKSKRRPSNTIIPVEEFEV
jgi:hypothetical protein